MQSITITNNTEVTMSPKEKSAELVKKYFRDSDLLVEDLTWIQAKECALIAVDEIIEQNNLWINQTGKGTNNYWQEVKEEIEKL
jgi:preprotein translocase subunit SecE